MPLVNFLAIFWGRKQRLSHVICNIAQGNCGVVYCVADTLPFLLRCSFLFEEGVTPLMLQLLGYAICELKSQPASSPQKTKKDKDKDKSKSKDKDADKEKEKHKDKEKTSG